MKKLMPKKKPVKNRQQSSARAGAVTGTLDITRSGMGFVIVPGSSNDVMVRPADFGNALHGDTVRVALKGNFSGRTRPQGEVVEVLQRKQLEFSGHLQLNSNFAFFIAEADKPMPDIFVPLDKTMNATENDMVVVKIIEWQKNKKPVGEVVQIMDQGDESDFAMKQILVEAGFSLIFPEEVIEESERIPDLIPDSEIRKRKDVRNVLTFTIDPIDAKDFDDAISLRTLKNGNYEIGVHIADVSHFVETDTALDKEAYSRATSVYLPDLCCPCCPKEYPMNCAHCGRVKTSSLFQRFSRSPQKEMSNRIGSGAQ